MLQNIANAVTGMMYIARCLHRAVVLIWIRYAWGEHIAKCLSKVKATIMNTEVHIDTNAMKLAYLHFKSKINVNKFCQSNTSNFKYFESTNDFIKQYNN